MSRIDVSPPRPRCAKCGGKIRRESDGLWTDIDGVGVGWHIEACLEQDAELAERFLALRQLDKTAVRKGWELISERGAGRVTRV